MKLYYDENSCQLAVVIQLGNDKFLRTTSTELQPIFFKKGRAFPRSLKTLSFIFFFFFFFFSPNKCERTKQNYILK